MATFRPMHPVLAELLRTGKSPTPDGDTVPLESHVLPDEAEFLSQVVRQIAPATSLEIGLAMGCSALAICDALPAKSTHIVIDPKQNARPLWRGIGLHNLTRAGFADRIEFHELPSHRALAQLESANRRIQFAFIDGFHTFDYALAGFFLVDRLLEPGGAVAFDDADWPSVRRVVRYVATNRAYVVHAAMPPRRARWSAARRAYEAVRSTAGVAFGAAAKLPGVGRAITAA